MTNDETILWVRRLPADPGTAVASESGAEAAALQTLRDCRTVEVKLISKGRRVRKNIKITKQSQIRNAIIA
jgi:hypothetical protein